MDNGTGSSIYWDQIPSNVCGPITTAAVDVAAGIAHIVEGGNFWQTFAVASAASAIFKEGYEKLQTVLNWLPDLF